VSDVETITLIPAEIKTETGAEAIAANGYTLIEEKTGEIIKKHPEGKPDRYGLRYFKQIKNEQGEDEEVEITRGEFKKDRKLHVTLQFNRIPRCQHKFVPGAEPRHRNCEMCWFTFFRAHGELTQSLDELFAKHGKAGLLQVRGTKFVKNFLKFMATLAEWKKQVEAAKGTGVTNGNEI
jgi:hypothetical protein